MNPFKEGLFKLLGKYKRDNSHLLEREVPYENRDFWDYGMGPVPSFTPGKAGNLGVKLHQRPSWLPFPGQGPDRTFTFGNNIVFPPGFIESGQNVDEMVQEELPHIQQWRDKGITGMIGHFLKDTWNHGFDYNKRYDEPNTLESYHYGITDSTWDLRGGKFDINDTTTYRSPIRESLPFGSDKGFDTGMGQRMINKLEPAKYE